MSDTKVYEQHIFENLLDKATIKSLSDEAFRAQQYKAEIINIERKYAITYRDLVKAKIIEKHEDIFAKIDQLEDEYKNKKRSLAEAQKKAGHERITRRDRVKSAESVELRELNKELNEARKQRNTWTKEILDAYFYKYDKMVKHFSYCEKIKYLVKNNLDLVRQVCPTLCVRYINDKDALIDAIVHDRNACYERLKTLRKEKKETEKENKTFTKQNLIDEEEKRIEEYKKLHISNKHLDLNTKALESISEKYTEAQEWQQIVKIRRELYDLEHEKGKNKFPCSPGTFAYVLSARERSRKDSLGGDGKSLSLPFCGWRLALPRTDPFDGTVICGSQIRLKNNKEICTPAKLLDGVSSKFKAKPSEVKLRAKNLRPNKIKQGALSLDWQPQIYDVDMLLRDTNKKKGVPSSDRLNFTVFFYREIPPDANIREIRVKVWRKNNILRYTLQLVVVIPSQHQKSKVTTNKSNAVAVIPCWRPHNIHDIIAADTYPNIRENENEIRVCDSTRNHDGSYTFLSAKELGTYRQKREKAESLQHIADNYFDTVKLRLYNNYKEDNKVKEIFDLVLKLLADEKKSYEKVKLDYTYEWKDHKKFHGFAEFLLEHYFDKDIINKQIWGKWRGDRFDSTGKCRFKTAFEARKAGEKPKDLFHDDVCTNAQSSASLDGWNDITAWVDVNYDCLSKLAKNSVSLKILRLAVYFYFWTKKDKHLRNSALRKQEKAIAARNDHYQKRSYELAKDYNYCIVLVHNLKNIAQKPKFEDDDREETLVASNSLRQKVAPSEFVNALKVAFGESRLIKIKANDEMYVQSKKDRDTRELSSSDVQLLFELGTKIIPGLKK